MDLVAAGGAGGGAAGGARAHRGRGRPPRRGARGAPRPRRAPGWPGPGDRARVLRRIHPHADRRDAQHARRDGQGTDAARTREAQAYAWTAGGGMAATGHERYSEDLGAYLLGALPDLEAEALERHAMHCDACRDELERLRPAADALPHSVEQHEPPPSLKRSLMAAVESDVRAAGRASRGRRERRL